MFDQNLKRMWLEVWQFDLKLFLQVWFILMSSFMPYDLFMYERNALNKFINRSV